MSLSASCGFALGLAVASVGCLESEDEVDVEDDVEDDVEVDVLDCSSPIRVSFDALHWSTAQCSNDTEPFEVDAVEEDDEGEEVDVTGEESE